MGRGSVLKVMAIAAFAGILPLSAYAWGPTSKRAIVGTSFQVLEQSFNNPFKNVNVDYEPDVIRGALANLDVLGGDVPLGSKAEVVNAIGTQIQLLREARKFGAGSYFAFRMGVLAGLVADVCLPYAYENDAASQQTLELIEKDIDEHITGYTYRTRRTRLEYVRNPTLYFTKADELHGDARTLIASDYKRGLGYDGFLKQGGQVFFNDAVQAVSDVWYTVLLPEGDSADIKPSDQALTRYLVDQIEYLLKVKKNVKEAERVYDQFAKQRSTLLGDYERIADAFYATGDKKGRERGVSEWTSALQYSGNERDRILKKLSQHYMSEGNRLFQLASNKDAPNDTLQNALGNFTKALEFDQSNQEAAKMINSTQVAITERDQRLKLAMETVAAGQSVMKKAEIDMTDNQNERALANFRTAIVVFSQVGDEFKEQETSANEGSEEARRMINRIINKVLDEAQDRIDEGDRLVSDNKFDAAVDAYKGVPTVLNVVPDDAPRTQGQQKAKLIELSQNKVKDAETAKRAFEEAEKARKAAAEAAKNAPAGAAPAAPARPAPRR
ncbi:MAG: hypothetical protein K1Y02_07845 [Candidatus Hydrogenedentes bacterium]|nr:hypothetical protein [Candidatus Hydrogenedentota bacterium]